MGRWAVRSPEHDPSLGLSAASIMLSLRTMHSPALAGDIDAMIGFDLDGDTFTGRYNRDGIDLHRAPLTGADVVFRGAPTVIAGAVYGEQMDALEAAGLLTVEGDRALAESFVTRFPLPAKWNEGDLP